MSKKVKYSKIDPRKRLLARMAGNVAAGLLSAPSEATASAEAIAAIAVDIAEAILKKVGVSVEDPLKPSVETTIS
jgi:hypothetical protein